MNRRQLLAATLVLGAWATGAQAHSHDREKAELLQSMGEVMPLQDVLALVAKDYPGQVLKVEFEDEKGKWIYEFKVLQDQGRLVKLEVDARDGKVLSVRQRSIHDKHDKDKHS
ncbi:PepSY domain-containing protein [Castellaniella sp.]|uniref:PepSY domain-containing protein n=1 Tax=Castellaniella sp. TaxID=1955812 RepID=UPI002AFF8AB3|nr:PepSY domain-containing protein [Castellaniella sp.]